MKVLILWLTVAASVLFCVLVTRSLINKRAERKRQTEYRLVTKSYAEALKPGITRRAVEVYLQKKGLGFRQVCCLEVGSNAYADLVKIGQEPPPWYCNKSNIYVAFDFKAPELRGRMPESRGSDSLVGVTMYPWLEECL